MGSEAFSLGVAVAAALLLGGVIGLVYDALRPLRRRSPPLAAALLDLLFCLLAGGGVFLLAMSAADGTLGLWQLTAALIGLLLYEHWLSDVFFGIFSAALDRLWAAAKFFREQLKKTAVLTKKFFQKMRECFIIKRQRRL